MEIKNREHKEGLSIRDQSIQSLKIESSHFTKKLILSKLKIGKLEIIDSHFEEGIQIEDCQVEQVATIRGKGDKKDQSIASLFIQNSQFAKELKLDHLKKIGRSVIKNCEFRSLIVNFSVLYSAKDPLTLTLDNLKIDHLTITNCKVDNVITVRNCQFRYDFKIIRSTSMCIWFFDCQFEKKLRIDNVKVSPENVKNSTEITFKTVEIGEDLEIHSVEVDKVDLHRVRATSLSIIGDKGKGDKTAQSIESLTIRDSELDSIILGNSTIDQLMVTKSTVREAIVIENQFTQLLKIESSHFTKRLKLGKLKIGKLEIIESHFEKGIEIAGCQVEQVATILGKKDKKDQFIISLSIVDSQFAKELKLDHLQKIGRSVIKNCEFRSLIVNFSEFSFVKDHPLTLDNLKIGRLTITNCDVNNEIRVKNCQFQYYFLIFRSPSMRICFSDCQFRKTLRIANGHVRPEITFETVNIEEDLEIHSVELSEVKLDRVRATNLSIIGDKGVSKINQFKIRDCSIRYTRIEHYQFEQNPEIENLSETASLSIKSSHFNTRFTLDNLKISQLEIIDLRCKKGIQLERCQFQELLSIRKGTIADKNDIAFNAVSIGGDLEIHSVEVNKVALHRVKAANLSIIDSKGKGDKPDQSIESLTIRDSELNSIILENSTIDQLEIAKSTAREVLEIESSELTGVTLKDSTIGQLNIRNIEEAEDISSQLPEGVILKNSPRAVKISGAILVEKCQFTEGSEIRGLDSGRILFRDCQFRKTLRIADVKVSPEEVKDGPEEVKDSPEEVKDSPEEVKDSPEEVKDSPEEVKDGPEEVKDSPEEVKNSTEITFETVNIGEDLEIHSVEVNKVALHRVKAADLSIGTKADDKGKGASTIGSITLERSTIYHQVDILRLD